LSAIGGDVEKEGAMCVAIRDGCNLVDPLDSTYTWFQRSLRRSLHSPQLETEGNSAAHAGFPGAENSR